jgi:hypothetical protein
MRIAAYPVSPLLTPIWGTAAQFQRACGGSAAASRPVYSGRRPEPPLQPDQGRHSPGWPLRAVAPVRIETRGVGVRAPLAAVDPCHPERLEALPREARQVALPAAGRARRKAHRCIGRRRKAGVAHFRADLVGVLADARPDPGQHLFRRRLQRRERGLEDTRRQAAPAGVGDADAPAVRAAEQHRQAVRRQHRQHPPGSPGRGAVGDAPRGKLGLVESQDPWSVHLFEPRRWLGQVERPAQQAPVLGHMGRGVADVLGEVQ